MKTQNQKALIEKTKKIFNPIEIERIARQCGFMKRRPKKISPLHLLFGLFILVLGEGNSLTNLATKIGLISNITISKQAVSKRINSALIKFLKTILTIAIIRTSKTGSNPHSENSLFSSFTRVLVQDSTSIKLDSKLAQKFPGAKNQTRKKSATLKIQAVIDILTEQFYHFDITPFNKNDQSVSEEILNIAQPSDLVIRDLGYFTCPVFKKMLLNNVFFFESVKTSR